MHSDPGRHADIYIMGHRRGLPFPHAEPQPSLLERLQQLPRHAQPSVCAMVALGGEAARRAMHACAGECLLCLPQEAREPRGGTEHACVSQAYKHCKHIKAAHRMVAPLEPPLPSALLYVPAACHARRTSTGP